MHTSNACMHICTYTCIKIEAHDLGQSCAHVSPLRVCQLCGTGGSASTPSTCTMSCSVHVPTCSSDAFRTTTTFYDNASHSIPQPGRHTSSMIQGHGRRSSYAYSPSTWSGESRCTAFVKYQGSLSTQSVFVTFHTGIRHACSSLIIIISSS